MGYTCCHIHICIAYGVLLSTIPTPWLPGHWLGCAYIRSTKRSRYNSVLANIQVDFNNWILKGKQGQRNHSLMYALLSGLFYKIRVYNMKNTDGFAYHASITLWWGCGASEKFWKFRMKAAYAALLPVAPSAGAHAVALAWLLRSEQAQLLLSRSTSTTVLALHSTKNCDFCTVKYRYKDYFW